MQTVYKATKAHDREDCLIENVKRCEVKDNIWWQLGGRKMKSQMRYEKWYVSKWCWQGEKWCPLKHFFGKDRIGTPPGSVAGEDDEDGDGDENLSGKGGGRNAGGRSRGGGHGDRPVRQRFASDQMRQGDSFATRMHTFDGEGAYRAGSSGHKVVDINATNDATEPLLPRAKRPRTSIEAPPMSHGADDNSMESKPGVATSSKSEAELDKEAAWQLIQQLKEAAEPTVG